VSSVLSLRGPSFGKLGAREASVQDAQSKPSGERKESKKMEIKKPKIAREHNLFDSIAKKFSRDQHVKGDTQRKAKQKCFSTKDAVQICN